MTLNMNENLNSPDWRELCKELAEFVARLTKHYYEPAELLVRARAAAFQLSFKDRVIDEDELLAIASELDGHVFHKN